MLLVPDEPGVGDGQTVEEVHEDHHDEEDEGNEDDVAHRVATVHKHQVLYYKRLFKRWGHERLRF